MYIWKKRLEFEMRRFYDVKELTKELTNFCANNGILGFGSAVSDRINRFNDIAAMCRTKVFLKALSCAAVSALYP